jgi:hypothetical protein
MLKRLLIACPFWASQVIYAQEYPTDSAVFTAKNSIKQYYNSQRGAESAIYNGKLFYSYPSGIEGIPYFHSANWQRGNVVYENIIYEDILMKYDQVKSQLIVTPNETGGMHISLYSPRIKEFRFSGFHFIYFNKKNDNSSLPEGFYQVLVKGTVTVFANTTKIISEKIVGITLYKKFEENVGYYLLKKGQYYHINSQNDLLNALEEHRKEIRGLLRSMKLNYRKDPFRNIISAVEFYNSKEN